MIARFQAPRIIYIFTKTTYITRNRKSSGPRKAQAFWGEEEQRNESELCEAQETRGSKFICEFERNSTVYCFVASGLLYSSIKEKKKVATSDMKLVTTKSALLIFPAGCPASIFSANELNYRVRDGNGWTLVAINTDA